MRDTLRVLNELEADGFYSRYAIGGAVAALFYTEATDTEDLDIFVHILNPPHPLTPMAQLYEEIRRRGYPEDGIYHLIEGVPVQFLPDSPELVEEAVRESQTIDFDGVPTRIPTPEHLIAIMVQTGRLKDRVRMLQMYEQAELDQARLAEILTRYHLLEKHDEWKQRQ